MSIKKLLDNKPVFTQSDENLIAREFENRSVHRVCLKSILELSTGQKERPREKYLEIQPGGRIYVAHWYYILDYCDAELAGSGQPVPCRLRFGPDCSDKTRAEFYARQRELLPVQ